MKKNPTDKKDKAGVVCNVPLKAQSRPHTGLRPAEIYETGKESYNVRIVNNLPFNPHQKIIQSFFSKVNKTDHCWIWNAFKNPCGYGVISVKNKTYLAHRFSWMLKFGSIPKGLLICHHCDNPPCVNPDHLFIGTYKDNSDDRDKKERQCFGGKHPFKNPLRIPIGVKRSNPLLNSLKTHCFSGHEFTPENTYMRQGKHRQCRICIRAAIRKYEIFKHGHDLKQRVSAFILRSVLVLIFLFSEMPFGFSGVIGKASWYSSKDTCKFNPDPKCPMANGRSIYDAEKKKENFVAIWGIPFGTNLKICNLKNGKCTEAVVSDRGPNKRLGRIIDLGKKTFSEIADPSVGVINVSVEILP